MRPCRTGREQMTDTTMQLLSQGTDPVKMPD
ncbi:phage tail protein, partial [Escherichia coli]